MVIEYLQQIKDSYFEQKHALEKQLNLLEIQLKENTGMIKMLEETNDSCYELFTPRNVNSKNKAKINELMEEQKTINESIENLKNSIKEYSSKIEQLDQIVEEENREIEIKSGNDYTKHKALDNLIAKQSWNINSGIVFCKGNLEIENGITYYPWYMSMFFKQETLPEHLKVNVNIVNI